LARGRKERTFELGTIFKTSSKRWEGFLARGREERIVEFGAI